MKPLLILVISVLLTSCLTSSRPSGDEPALKTIKYRGGLVTFRVPAHWKEDYEPEGGGTFYDARPIQLHSDCRLSLLKPHLRLLWRVPLITFLLYSWRPLLRLSDYLMDVHLSVIRSLAWNKVTTSPLLTGQLLTSFRRNIVSHSQFLIYDA